MGGGRILSVELRIFGVAWGGFVDRLCAAMKDEFNNRLTSFTTTLTFLDAAGNTGIWLNQKPLMFGSKVGMARSAVSSLREFCRQQGGADDGGGDG